MKYLLMVLLCLPNFVYSADKKTVIMKKKTSATYFQSQQIESVELVILAVISIFLLKKLFEWKIQGD